MADRQASLFRTEAADYGRNGQLGHIVLTHAFSQSVWIGVCGAFGVALLCFASFATYTSRVTVSGILMSSNAAATLRAPRDIRVASIPISVGDAVRRGTPIMEMQPLQSEAMMPLGLNAIADGVVTGVMVRVGDVVKSGSDMVQIQPDGPLIGKVLVPLAAAHALHVGMVISLRYQSYPYRQFGLFRAKVRSISTIPLMSGDLTKAGSGEPMYVLSLIPEGRARDGGANPDDGMPLASGMHFESSIPLQTRSIFSWLFDKSRTDYAKGQ